MTYSGEFLHAAPWSVAYQGHANVSHGCTGMSTANAGWLYHHSQLGDVVEYTGTRHADDPHQRLRRLERALRDQYKHRLRPPLTPTRRKRHRDHAESAQTSIEITPSRRVTTRR